MWLPTLLAKKKKKVDFSVNIEFAIVLICNVDLIEKNEGQPASVSFFFFFFPSSKSFYTVEVNFIQK